MLFPVPLFSIRIILTTQTARFFCIPYHLSLFLSFSVSTNMHTYSLILFHMEIIQCCQVLHMRTLIVKFQNSQICVIVHALLFFFVLSENNSIIQTNATKCFKPNMLHHLSTEIFTYVQICILILTNVVQQQTASFALSVACDDHHSFCYSYFFAFGVMDDSVDFELSY